MTKRRRMLIVVPLTLVVAYFALLPLVNRFQDRMAFPGAGGSLPDPTSVGFERGERVELSTSDGKTITGWFIPAARPAGTPTPVLLWFHGNRETVFGVSDFIRFLVPDHVAMLAIDYRGYGESTGNPTEAFVYADAELAWDYAASRPEVDSSRVILYGRSVGSAVALELAQRRTTVGVILDSPFSSAYDMGRRHYPFLPARLGRLKLDNVTNASRLTAPLLVLHGEDDYIAPVEMGQAVANAGDGAFLVFPQTGHNEMYTADVDRYRRAVHEFIRTVLGTD